MKQTKLISVLLVILVAFAWLTALTDTGTEETEEYETHVSLAEEYVKRGLYQKAIQEYDAAIAMQSSTELWDKKLEAYKDRYAESTDIYNEYLRAAESAVSRYSDNASYLMILANLHIVREDYVGAYKVLNRAVEAGMKNADVETLLLDVKYAYQLDWKAYVDYRTCVNGFYPVSGTGVWTYIEEDGTDTEIAQLVLAGPVGEGGIRVVQNQTRAQLVDSNNEVQGILNFIPEDAGVYSQGLVPIKKDGTYGYYNSLGDYQFGTYQNAGTFTEGQAAVQEKDRWFLIDTTGKKCSEKTYEEIVLNRDGSYCTDGVMLVKEGGKYKFLKDGQTIGAYDDVDVITSDKAVAVCKGSKWGFVDLEGKELIAPKYKKAKSFSNGLAAVSNGEQWGFIDLKGDLVIDYTFYDADYFNSEKCCMIELGRGTGWQMLSLYN